MHCYLNSILKRIILIIFLVSSINEGFSQTIYINEIESNNASVLLDEDGEYSDWIEIYNADTVPLNITGFGLSDNVDLPLKWQFPTFYIAPNEYLTVFASGKNKTNIPSHWETVIDHGDIWKYFPGSYEPQSSWNSLSFNDSLWQTGPSGFGYGDNDDSTIISSTISLYIRKTFEISDLSNITDLVLHIDFDDGFVAYINGIEIARENIGTIGIPPGFNDPADTYTEPQMVQGNLPFRYEIIDWQSILQAGENVLAIQVHNNSISSSDLSLIPFLTLGMNNPPTNSNGIPEILAQAFNKLHTNFKIKSSGESIILSDSTGTLVDIIEAAPIPADCSYGRQANLISNLVYFDSPTPSLINNSQHYDGIAHDPEFSIQGGMYQGIVSLSLSSNDVNDTIYYTTNNTEPDQLSLIYSTPILIDSSKVIRAKIYNASFLSGRVITNSYLLNESSDLPVISITSDPDNFWSNDNGIFVLGDNANADFPFFGANFWEDWERKVHIEMFEGFGPSIINMEAGIKIFGGYSRGNPQKSIAVYARGDYGYGSIDHKLFNDKDISQFESIVLRNSGNEWDKTMFRDAMMTSLIGNLNIDRLAYQPSITFLNGKYYGILNIREKTNEHFIKSNHPWVDETNIDLLEWNSQAIHGDNIHYEAMIDFMAANNLNTPSNYEHLGSLMDIEEFINYQVSQIYFNNTDWPGNNIKYWRPRTETGKWRWIIYDTDFGFGPWGEWDFANNTLHFALSPNGPNWPNPPWSTYLFRKITESYEFKKDFINRFADLLNTTFLSDNVSSHIDSLSFLIEDEIPRHINKWNVTSLGDWYWNIQNMKNFAISRPSYMRDHIKMEFDLQGQATTTLDISHPNAGIIQLNTLSLDEFPWTGIYFRGNPIKLTAIAKPGYKFVGWSGITTSTEATIEIDLYTNALITANFEEDPNQIGTIVINEINYNSSPDFNPDDWIELYNSSTEDIDVSSWTFMDSNESHIFTIPENTIIESDKFLILCKDSIQFSMHFPAVHKLIGNFNFGLSNSGELLRLFDLANNLVDFVDYSDYSPWPIEPDGLGATLELANPYFDNNIASSWKSNSGNGSPMHHNNNLLDIRESIDTSAEIFELSCYPNPFRTATNIEIKLKNYESVSIKIFDVNGLLIKTISDSNSTPGIYTYSWMGTNNNNDKVPAGIYFLRIISENYSESKKVILLN